MQEHLFAAVKMRSCVENVPGARRCDFYFNSEIGKFDSPVGLVGGDRISVKILHLSGVKCSKVPKSMDTVQPVLGSSTHTIPVWYMVRALQVHNL